MLRLRIPELTTEQIDRLWSKISTATGQGPFGTCWEFQAYTDKNGYGYIRFGKKMYRPFRVVYKLYYGKEPDVDSLHRCDNPKCCHPFHLDTGTRLDNMRDKMAKRRDYDKRGEGNPRCRLTAAIVLKIRERLAKNEMVRGSEYNVSDALIRRIDKRLVWKHI